MIHGDRFREDRILWSLTRNQIECLHYLFTYSRGSHSFSYFGLLREAESKKLQRKTLRCWWRKRFYPLINSKDARNMENLRWQNDEIARIKMLYVSFGMEFVFRQMSNKCPGPFPEEIYSLRHAPHISQD